MQILIKEIWNPAAWSADQSYWGNASMSALDFIEGWGKIFDKNMFLLDRPFPATPDFRVFGGNVALGRGHV